MLYSCAMARELFWNRGVNEFINGSESNGHFWDAASFSDGDTLTRLRFHWQAFHSANSFTAEGVGFAVVLGAIVLPSSVGTPPFPASDPTADWLWWETGFLVPRPVWEGPSAGSTEIDMAPSNPGFERDVKAQRKADPAGSTLWFVSENTTVSPTQSRHWLSVSFSAGVLAPP